MQKKSIIAIVSIVVVLGIAGALFAVTRKSSTPNATANTDNSGSSSSTQQNTSTQAKQYTAQEVAAHSTRTDCWTIISGNVYDITSYVPRHPGGDEILRACGTDGTTLFTARTTSDGQKIGSGTPHDSTAQAQLASMQIGVLAK